ncbi:MAG: IPT/TIG domain-containing protein [Candidatus Dormibacteria bacterium]
MSFPGTAQETAISTFGNDQQVTPPNEDVAASPSDVVEVVNSTIYVFNRSGGTLGAADLNVFMGVNQIPGFHSSDPRAIYDASAGRFWVTVTEVPDSYSPGNCPPAAPVLIAVSASSNPLPFSGWIVYGLPMAQFGGSTGQPLTEFGDQPGLGISTNTVTVTWDDFTCAGGFNGSEIDVLQKTDFEKNQGFSSLYYFYDGPSAPQPVQALGAMALTYIVSNQSDCASNGCLNGSGYALVQGFTGTPEGSTGVTNGPYVFVPMTPTVSGTGFLPPADQPSPAPQLQTNDDRFLNAVWENGQIWTADGTSCQLTGDTAQRDCLNYVETAASGTTNTIGGALTNQLDNVSIIGSDLFYPAVSLDSAGDVITVFDESSTTMNPSIIDASIASGTSTLSSFHTLHTSPTYYNGNDLFAGACDTNGCRWGDYSGAAQDPVNPKDVWVVSGSVDNTTALGACTTIHACWNTQIDEVTVSGPVITALTQSLGPVAGGQTVTVSGTDFDPTTTATFGGSPIAITLVSPQVFTFVTAPSAPGGGTDPVQATDLLGTTNTVTYTYEGLANYTPMTPFRILDTRNTGGPIGQGLIRAVQVTGLGTIPVPAGASAAVLNVTEVLGSASSLLTVYPYGSVRPTASNLNFGAQTVIANLVTVTLGVHGGQGWINIYNAVGSVNVAVDVEGYFATAPATTYQGLFHPIAPVRVCDTRRSCDGHGVVGAGQSIVVTVASAGGIPGDSTAEAAVVNLTGVTGSAGTYLSLFPTNANGTCSPTGTSTSNLAAGAVVANRVMVKLGPTSTGGPNDALCVFNAAGTINVLIDANGWYGSSTITASPAGYQYQPLPPTRICDTRFGSTSCDTGAIGGGVVRLIRVAGNAGVPAFGSSTTVVAMVANLTAVAPSAGTYLTLYPANLLRPPIVSDVNVNAAEVLPNLAVVQLDTIPADAHDGQVYLFNSVGSVNAIIDLEGWFQ